MASRPNLRVEVRMGESSRPAMEFVFGERVDPFSVGSQGTWEVSGPGTAAEHGYLYFDGETLFAASAEGATVIQRGKPVGTDWLPLEVPTNLHLGGVKLAVRGPSSKPQADDAPSMQEVPASRRVGPHGPVVPTDDEATVMHNPRAMVQPRPQVPAPDESERTVIQPLVGSEMPEEDMATTVQPLPSHPAVDHKLKAPSAHGAPPPAAGTPAPSSPIAAPPSPIGVPPSAFGAPSGPSAPVPLPTGVSSPAVAPPPQVQSSPLAAPPGVAQQPSSPAGSPAPAAAAAASPVAQALAPAIKAWKEASIPQRIILVLLPFAFVSVFFVFSEPEPEATTEPAPSASASSLASTAHPRATASVARNEKLAAPSGDAPTAAPSEPAAPTSGKSLERKAADAVAAGDYAVAAELYDELSKQQPDKAVFREARDILQRKPEH